MSEQKHIRREQMSESIWVNLLLAFSGGFQDAYTYTVRDHVFANAQTGNIVLLSTHFMQGEWQAGFRYLLPVLAFAAGVFIAENIQHYFKNARALHWRQGVLIIEILIMIAVGFMPQAMNLPANIMVSFACAMQIQTFRKVRGNPYASTMCIGNLRSGTEAFSGWLRERDAADREKVLDYFRVILVFAIGAGLGGSLSARLSERTIWISAIMLIVSFALMEIDREA